CMEAIGNFNGAVVSTGTCFKVSPYIEAWTVENGGSDTDIGPATNLRVFGDKCLDVKDGVNANGTKVQIWTCGENNPNQKFNVNWDGSISWDRTGKCVDVTGAPGDGGLGTFVQIWECRAGNPNQKWIAPYLGTGNPIIQWAHHHKCVSTINRHDDAEVSRITTANGEITNCRDRLSCWIAALEEIRPGVRWSWRMLQSKIK
ncbi:ricin B lectin domain-containing protein, partial [Mycena floridula]